MREMACAFHGNGCNFRENLSRLTCSRAIDSRKSADFPSGSRRHLSEHNSPGRRCIPKTDEAAPYRLSTHGTQAVDKRAMHSRLASPNRFACAHVLIPRPGRLAPSESALGPAGLPTIHNSNYRMLGDARMTMRPCLFGTSVDAWAAPERFDAGATLQLT